MFHPYSNDLFKPKIQINLKNKTLVQYFDFERRLFQKRVAYIKLNICVFLTLVWEQILPFLFRKTALLSFKSIDSHRSYFYDRSKNACNNDSDIVLRKFLPLV